MTRRTRRKSISRGNVLKTKLSARVAAIRDQIKESQLDALMVSTQENRYYLSGFSAEDGQFDESSGVLFISDKGLVLATDSRYVLQAQDEAAGYDIVCYDKGFEKALPDIVKSLDIRRLGFESVRLSYKNHAAYVRALRSANPSVELVPTENIVEFLRRVKSEDEIQRTVEALRLAERVFTDVLGRLRTGMTEKQVAWDMEKSMRQAGAQSIAFPVIVASGPNSALPHAVPTDRKLGRGEPILFDWGARLNAYCSDTTRTVIIGSPNHQFKKVFDTVVTARDLAIDAIRAGASGTQVDRIARDYIEHHGFAGRFGHSLGHGTGLAVHEAPRLSPIKDDRLETGMIVTVEPGIYIPEWGGIRMENQVVVRQDHAQVLNDPTPFDPQIGS